MQIDFPTHRTVQALLKTSNAALRFYPTAKCSPQYVLERFPRNAVSSFAGCPARDPGKASDRDNCFLSHWTPCRSPPIRGVRSSLSSWAHAS